MQNKHSNQRHHHSLTIGLLYNCMHSSTSFLNTWYILQLLMLVLSIDAWKSTINITATRYCMHGGITIIVVALTSCEQTCYSKGQLVSPHH